MTPRRGSKWLLSLACAGGLCGRCLKAVVPHAMDATKKVTQQTPLWTAALDWFTVYRQLFAWIFAFNLAVAIVAATGTWNWAHTHRVQFAVANTLISVLARNEVTPSRQFLLLLVSHTMAHGLLLYRFSCAYCTPVW